MTELQAPQPGEFLLYETEDGRTRVECRFAEDTLWLSQAMMAELFQTSPQNITLHLKALYAEGEITAEATCKSYLQVQSEGSGRSGEVSSSTTSTPSSPSATGFVHRAAHSSDAGPPNACASIWSRASLWTTSA